MTKTIRKPSAIPILGIGGVWLIWGLALPMYRPWHLLLPAAASVGVYFLLNKLFPGRTVEVYVRPTTGNEALDAMIEEGEKSLAQIRALNEAIPDEKLSRQLSELEQLTDRIFESVKDSPEKLPQLRRFMNYYLPTTLKLLEQYRVLQDRGVREGNVAEAMGKIEKLMDTVLTAFRKQLDSLYEKDVMDITADIQVMEQMMQSEGILINDEQ